MEGYCLQFRWDRQEVGEVVRGIALPNFSLTEEPPDVVYHITGTEEQLQVKSDGEIKLVSSLDQLPQNLERTVQLEVATYAPQAVFVHSGVVRWRDRLVVVPGKSYSGKSTLTEALCRAGACYYSDEYAIVDSQGLVRPWPRSLSLRVDQGRDKIGPEELNWRNDFGPTEVALVVSTKYSADATWEPQELSKGQAVMELLANTVSAQLEPQRALDFLSRMVERAACLKGERGEAEATAKAILARLG